jgi:hypothetical protein
VINKEGSPFTVRIPPDTSEAAYLCFLYATKRAGEVPIPRGASQDGEGVPREVEFK